MGNDGCHATSTGTKIEIFTASIIIFAFPPLHLSPMNNLNGFFHIMEHYYDKLNLKEMFVMMARKDSSVKEFLDCNDAMKFFRREREFLSLTEQHSFMKMNANFSFSDLSGGPISPLLASRRIIITYQKPE